MDSEGVLYRRNFQQLRFRPRVDSELGMADETPDDVMHSVCDPGLPDAGKVWDGVVELSAP